MLHFWTNRGICNFLLWLSSRDELAFLSVVDMDFIAHRSWYYIKTWKENTYFHHMDMINIIYISLPEAN